MKLGNISQTIVPVPNFFVDQKNRTLETFNLYQKSGKSNKVLKKILKLNLNTISSKSHNSSLEKNKERDGICKTSRRIPKFGFKKKSNYYRDCDLLTTFYNLNINKNPRNFTRQWIRMNEEKYIPLYYRNEYNNFQENKKTYFPDIIDVNKPKSVTKKFLTLKCCENYNDYEEYKKKQDIQGFLQPNLREELQTETKNLIDRINMNYDIKKWNKFDSRTTLNRFYQTEYGPLKKVIKHSETLSEKFGRTLKLKALNLSNINNQTKKVIEKSMSNNNIDDDIDNNINEDKYYKTLVKNSENFLLKLKYNNEENPKYNSKDKEFINENKFITKKINKTKLYKDFPSKTREEFNEKKIVKYKSLGKNYKYLGNIKLKDKYGNEDDFKDVLINEDYLKTMWKRPLHKDAYKLHE